jgi:hypothetical protein
MGGISARVTACVGAACVVAAAAAGCGAVGASHPSSGVPAAAPVKRANRGQGSGATIGPVSVRARSGCRSAVAAVAPPKGDIEPATVTRVAVGRPCLMPPR